MGEKPHTMRLHASGEEILLSLTDFTRGVINDRVGGHHKIATLLDEKLQADNVVGEIMHHDTSCLTEGPAERDIVSCCEMATLWR